MDRSHLSVNAATLPLPPITHSRKSKPDECDRASMKVGDLWRAHNLMHFLLDGVVENRPSSCGGQNH